MPLGGLLRRAAVEHRQFDVVERGRPRQQVESLEDEADAPVAHFRQLVLRHRRDVLAVEQVLAGRRPIQAADDVHEGRLARSRRSGDGQELAARHVDIDAAQRAHLVIADDEGLDQVARRDHRWRRARRSVFSLIRIRARRPEDRRGRAASTGHQRIAVVRRAALPRRCLQSGHAGRELHVVLQFARQQFGERAVADAEPQRRPASIACRRTATRGRAFQPAAGERTAHRWSAPAMLRAWRAFAAAARLESSPLRMQPCRRRVPSCGRGTAAALRATWS